MGRLLQFDFPLKRAIMKKPRVLFVDDEPNILDDLEEIFGYAGQYEFFTAASGRQALEILQKHDVDLVITDIRMPEMDGLELAGQIRQNHPSVKILFITAVQDLIGLAVKLNPIDVMEKPIRKDILLHKVEKYFENKRRINIGKWAAIGGGVLTLFQGFSLAVQVIKEPSFSNGIQSLIFVALLIFFAVVAIRLWRA